MVKSVLEELTGQVGTCAHNSDPKLRNRVLKGAEKYDSPREHEAVPQACARYCENSVAKRIQVKLQRSRSWKGRRGVTGGKALRSERESPEKGEAELPKVEGVKRERGAFYLRGEISGDAPQRGEEQRLFRERPTGRRRSRALPSLWRRTPLPPASRSPVKRRYPREGTAPEPVAVHAWYGGSFDELME
ncbi:hypothetical protein MRX96_009467 [Rhipicephalus microplus]